MKKGKHWFNNGVIQIIRQSLEDCPPGFTSGMLPVSEQSKEKNRQAHLGKIPWNKDKSSRKHSQEEKLACGKSNRGKHYYNNGIIELRAFDCPDGFTPGRLKASTRTPNKGKCWFTNGLIEVSAQSCPEGFHPGRLPKSEETKKKISKAGLGRKHTAETKAKIGKASINRPHSEESKKKIGEAQRYLWNKKTQEEKDVHAARCAEQTSRPDIQEKIWATKKKNKTCNTSKPEEKYYKYLCTIYGPENVIRQYFDKDRYPFHCDFYIKPEDLFIELNLSHFHNFRPFNTSNLKDQKDLETLRQKAANHPTPENNQYLNIIKVWTIQDPLKIKTAKENNLNYKVYWLESELEYNF